MGQLPIIPGKRASCNSEPIPTMLALLLAQANWAVKAAGRVWKVEQLTGAHSGSLRVHLRVHSGP